VIPVDMMAEIHKLETARSGDSIMTQIGGNMISELRAHITKTYNVPKC
jgi:hypothetical protein